MIKHRKLIDSFGFAIEGIRYAFEEDQNIKIHLIAAIFVVILCILFDVTAFEMGILGLMILLVIAAEMINTAIENMVDLITKEYHIEAKRAKDVGAGMVLVISIGAAIIGFLIFTPYIFRLF